MRFTNPLYLLLLLPIGLGLILSFRSVHGMAKGRKRLAFVIRFLLAGGLAVAISGPEARRPNHGLCTIFLVDRSDSVSEADRARTQQFVDGALQRLGPSDEGGVIAFGKDAIIDSAPGGRRGFGKVLSKVDASASDLAGAIRLASASFPEGKAKRIVLLSDGNETGGDVMEAAQVAATDGIAIDHVPLGLRPRDGEASVISLEAPAEMPINQPFDLRLNVDSSREQAAQIDLDRDGVTIKKLTATLVPGRNSILVGDKLTDPGFHRYRATVRAAHDVDIRNNVGMAFVAIKGQPRVLVLQEDPNHRELSAALHRKSIVADVVGPVNIPAKPEDLQAYDAIILNDINAANFTESQMKMVRSAVSDSGIGFAMIGGENSFLPGGYYGSPIADVLPVDLNIRQRKTFPSTSICIIVDASGSMGMLEDGIEKIRLAAKAAEETVKLLSPMDRVGVAGSTDGIEFVAPMQKLDDKGAVIAQIRKLSTGGGGIYINPSVQKGKEVLEKENSKVRHFILLADGDDSDSQEGAIQIALQMRAEKITTTVVAIGDGKDVSFLRALAAAGGGRYYLAKRASQLPAIFTQDAAVMSRSAIEEGAFLPKLNPSEEILRGIADAGTPPLLAYCISDARPIATVGMRSQKDDPILAKWQYGLGTSIAFTSDAQARWASHWVGWEGFDTFWAQAVREISRRATLNNYQVAVKNEGGNGRIDLKAFDKFGNPMTSSAATIKVAAPDGTSRDVSLDEQAPGEYSGTFNATDIGTYIVTVAEPDGKGGARSTARGFSLAYPAEYRSYRANRPLLDRVSSTTKGKALADPAEALRPVPDAGESITELWMYFVLAGALLLPLDIGVRRIALPVADILAKAIMWVRSRRTERMPHEQEQVVARLQQARKRVQREGGETIEVNPSPEATPKPRPVISTKPGGSASSSLLEAKRRRRDGTE